VSDLAEFLLARIAEDEAEAPDIHDDDMWSDGCSCNFPARWLAECEAKRRIVELHSTEREHQCPNEDGTSDYYNHLRGWAEEVEHPQVCPTLRLLALPYADSEGYREEWRP
jgi:hypothetical protein